MLFKNEHKIDTKALMVFSVLLAGCSVLLGAFAAHGLQYHLSAKNIAIFQTGVRYMMWHSIGAICYGIYSEIASIKELWPGWVFILGIFLFSGSLFVISLTSISWIGMITPIGGLCFVIGWFGFFLDILKR